MAGDVGHGISVQQKSRPKLIQNLKISFQSFSYSIIQLDSSSELPSRSEARQVGAFLVPAMLPPAQRGTCTGKEGLPDNPDDCIDALSRRS
jgi:hypothetical protein